MKSISCLIVVLLLTSFGILKAQNDTNIFSYCEVMPLYPGGETGLQEYLETSIVYPENEKLLLREGTVYVFFVVNQDGSICNIRIVKSVPGAPEFDQEVTRVIAAMPNWMPGTMNGRKVRCGLTLPVRFVLGTPSDSLQNGMVPASYPGGSIAMNNYIDSNLVYPDSALNAGDSGIVKVRFIVERDGSISHPILLDPYHTPRTLRVEAIRLITAMPKWNPAAKDGVTVRSGVTVAVNFKLPAKKEMKATKKKSHRK